MWNTECRVAIPVLIKRFTEKVIDIFFILFVVTFLCVSLGFGVKFVLHFLCLYDISVWEP